MNFDGDFGRNRMEIMQNMKKRDRTELNLQNLTVFLQISGGNCGNMSGVLRCSYEKRQTPYNGGWSCMEKEGLQ